MPATAAVGLTLLLAACSAAPGEPTSAPAELAPAADCLAPQVIDALGLPAAASPAATAHPDAPAAGSVPEDFLADSVVECTTGETLTDADGVWAAVTARRLEGDLEPLLTALADSAGAAEVVAASAVDGTAQGKRRSDAQAGTDSADRPGAGTGSGSTGAADAADGACAGTGVPMAQVWLVDALGRGIWVTVPVDDCGRLLRPVERALAGLEEIDVAHYPVELVEPRTGVSPTP
ncbi:hypothetical protein [Cellulomonas hominis]